MESRRLACCEAAELEAVGEGETGRTAPTAFPLVRFGRNEYTRDGKRGEFEFTEADADEAIGDFARRGRDLVIDYEHETLSAGRAPAAGWIMALKKSAEGLTAVVRYWTDQAKAFLENGEYRYYSPVLRFSRTGKRVTGIHSVALTNHPALHGIPALVADDGAGDEGLDNISPIEPNPTEESPMKAILETLGLSDLPEAEATEKAVASVTAARETLERLNAFLATREVDSLEALNALMDRMVPVEEKQALEQRLRERDAADAVKLALSEGKITRAKEDWATRFALRDLAAFAEWTKDAPRLVPDNAVPASEAPIAPAPVALTDQEKDILAAVGVPAGTIPALAATLRA